MDFKYETEYEVNIEKYYEPFLQSKSKVTLKATAALDRAWKNRDFEINKYWSRATYFWAFIAASFAGYFLVNSSVAPSTSFPELSFIISSLGLVFSAAWYFVNIGSKKWQENWEKHIDLLEDIVTGPIYKTVLNDKGYSVSKINLVISKFVLFIWGLLWVRAMFPWSENLENWRFSWLKFLITTFSLIFIIDMLAKHDGNRRTKNGVFSFRRRKIIKKN